MVPVITRSVVTTRSVGSVAVVDREALFLAIAARHQQVDSDAGERHDRHDDPAAEAAVRGLGLDRFLLRGELLRVRRRRSRDGRGRGRIGRSRLAARGRRRRIGVVDRRARRRRASGRRGVLLLDRSLQPWARAWPWTASPWCSSWSSCSWSPWTEPTEPAALPQAEPRRAPERPGRARARPAERPPAAEQPRAGRRAGAGLGRRRGCRRDDRRGLSAGLRRIRAGILRQEQRARRGGEDHRQRNAAKFPHDRLLPSWFGAPARAPFFTRNVSRLTARAAQPR